MNRYAGAVSDERDTQGLLSEVWNDDDTDAVQSIMADYMDGPKDGYAKAKLWRMIAERAEAVISRAHANQD